MPNYTGLETLTQDIGSLDTSPGFKDYTHHPAVVRFETPLKEWSVEAINDDYAKFEKACEAGLQQTFPYTPIPLSYKPLRHEAHMYYKLEQGVDMNLNALAAHCHQTNDVKHLISYRSELELHNLAGADFYIIADAVPIHNKFAGEVRAVREVKWWVNHLEHCPHDNPDDLSNIRLRYNTPNDASTDPHVYHAIHQTVTYMVREKCRYGMLTCWKYSWLLKLELVENSDKCRLYVSDAYGEADAMRRMWQLMMYAASEKWKLIPVTGNAGDKLLVDQHTQDEGTPQDDVTEHSTQAQSASSSAKRSRTSHSKPDSKAYQTTMCLSTKQMADHTHNAVWLGRYMLQRAIIKISQINNNFDSNCVNAEVESYNRLRSHWSTVTPALINHWRVPRAAKATDDALEQQNKRTFNHEHVLVLQYDAAMQPLSSLVPTGYTEAERSRAAESARAALRTIHSHGILHRDVRGANILYDRQTNRTWFIDFEVAKFDPTNEATEAEMRQLGWCLQELLMLS